MKLICGILFFRKKINKDCGNILYLVKKKEQKKCVIFIAKIYTCFLK